MSFFVVAGRATETNGGLIAAVKALGMDAALLRPGEARVRVSAGDSVLGRVDVLRTLDGVEACLWELRRLERHGTRVLNGVGALLCAHDKLMTAVRLGRAGIAHPRTVHLDGERMPESLELPIVLKPRFGSWGRDVVLCESEEQLAQAFRQLRRRRWFRRHGILAQEYVPNAGHDLRILVASGEVVGAVERVAAPGEWRTNIALGGTRRSVLPPPQARAVATAAAAALGADLVAVDVLPTPDGEFVALEVNGAAEFTTGYSLDGADVYTVIARRLTGIAQSAAA